MTSAADFAGGLPDSTSYPTSSTQYMKTSVYLRPPKKLLEYLPKLENPARMEMILDVTGTNLRRAVLHIQKGYAQVYGPHHVIDSDDQAPFAFTGAAVVAF